MSLPKLQCALLFRNMGMTCSLPTPQHQSAVWEYPPRGLYVWAAKCKTTEKKLIQINVPDLSSLPVQHTQVLCVPS